MEYTYKKLIIEVLETVNRPLSSDEIWQEALNLGLNKKLISQNGKTPSATISARIYVDMQRNEEKSKFKKMGKNPMRFFLRNKEPNKNVVVKKEQSKFHEKDLHQLLTNFVIYNNHFKCNAKTINHSKSKKYSSGERKWVYPDMVGVYYPFNNYDKKTIDLMESLKNMQCKLFSFELKIELNFSNIREYYFQAVSNSSWANEGYIVALNYKDQLELSDEMRRLNNAFGIGFIKLNSESIEESEILFNAKEKTDLDWETIDRLVYENTDFSSLVQGINDDMKISKVQYGYDKVLDQNEIEKYISEKEIK